MFEQIVGHQNVKEIWGRSLESGRVGHAYLLSGPEGVGKFKIAKAMAVSLVAGDDSNAEHMAIENNHPDIMIIEPEVSKNLKLIFK